MSAKSRPFTPQLITANDLLTGDVVWRSAPRGWSRDPADAIVASDAPRAQGLLDEASREVGRVVGPYLVDASLDAEGRPTPSHYRERLRMLGPSIRPDLGRQAEAAN